ncbi:hypothetical protein [Actinoplanes flavus]|uniref:Uncharacterized protein n=1 Tax=Actinoplanes flavus TaxID=2820290 RepID=A0ABS3UDX3_9ACTN|nr:hypothetical protein [Actinoplanes flavus]MBO3736646.1 hypothetical protein [Actinoplanes flavus]
MFDHLDANDRRTRRSTGLNRPSSARKYVLVGEKEFYDTTSADDYREFRVVRDYNRQ